MTSQVQAHETRVSFLKAAQAELYAGSDIALKVKVSCPSGCDLRGSKVRITADEGALVQEIELASFDGTGNETAEFILKAPSVPGEYSWAVIFPVQERAGILHGGSAATFSFVVKPHKTGIAVWHVPSPVVLNTKFKIKVGVECSLGCDLAGKEVEICDHSGRRLATAPLGGAPWVEGGALHWTEVELEAPTSEGLHSWEARFPETDTRVSHAGTSFNFSFRTARQPDHTVTVEVVDRAGNAPISRAEVILHPYREHTDERGLARLMVPKGDYELYVTASDMEIFHTAVSVASDVAVKAELVLAPVPDTSG